MDPFGINSEYQETSNDMKIQVQILKLEKSLCPYYVQIEHLVYLADGLVVIEVGSLSKNPCEKIMGFMLKINDKPFWNLDIKS